MSIADRIAVMNLGVLEQMDSPEEIYARPSTLFVATFIGTMNRLDAFVEAEGRIRAGPFAFEQPQGMQSTPEGPLVAGIRPEDLLIETGGDGIRAQIEHVVDLGHYRRVSLRAEGVSLLAFTAKSDELPTDQATLRARRVLVYADDRLVGVSEPMHAAAEGLVASRQSIEFAPGRFDEPVPKPYRIRATCTMVSQTPEEL